MKAPLTAAPSNIHFCPLIHLVSNVRKPQLFSYSQRHNGPAEADEVTDSDAHLQMTTDANNRRHLFHPFLFVYFSMKFLKNF